MPDKTYTVTQTREVKVSANSSHAAKTLANKAFYGNRPSKADPEGMVLSAVQVKDTDIKEGV